MKKTITYTLVALALASCSDNELVSTNTNDSNDEIRFDVTTQTLSRANIMHYSSLTACNVVAGWGYTTEYPPIIYMNTEGIEKNSDGTWSFQSENSSIRNHYWPESQFPLDFYASTNTGGNDIAGTIEIQNLGKGSCTFPDNVNKGTGSITGGTDNYNGRPRTQGCFGKNAGSDIAGVGCHLKNNADENNDIMLAAIPHKTKADGTVTLKFKHMFAAYEFKCKTDIPNLMIYIDRITIKNLKCRSIKPVWYWDETANNGQGDLIIIADAQYDNKDTFYRTDGLLDTESYIDFNNYYSITETTSDDGTKVYTDTKVKVDGKEKEKTPVFFSMWKNHLGGTFDDDGYTPLAHVLDRTERAAQNNGIFLLFPQTLNAWDGTYTWDSTPADGNCYLEVKCRIYNIADAKTHVFAGTDSEICLYSGSFVIPFAVNCEAGKLYVVGLNFSKNGNVTPIDKTKYDADTSTNKSNSTAFSFANIDFTVEYTDWDPTNENEIRIYSPESQGEVQ